MTVPDDTRLQVLAAYRSGKINLETTERLGRRLNLAPLPLVPSIRESIDRAVAHVEARDAARLMTRPAWPLSTVLGWIAWRDGSKVTADAMGWDELQLREMQGRPREMEAVRVEIEQAKDVLVSALLEGRIVATGVNADRAVEQVPQHVWALVFLDMHSPAVRWDVGAGGVAYTNVHLQRAEVVARWPGNDSDADAAVALEPAATTAAPDGESTDAAQTRIAKAALSDCYPNGLPEGKGAVKAATVQLDLHFKELAAAENRNLRSPSERKWRDIRAGKF